jgi:hypothetical protein
MAGQDHIHIITAGEETGAILTEGIRDLPDITHAFVFADTDLYTNTAQDNETIRTMKNKVRKSVDQAKSVAASLSIPCLLFYIPQPAFPPARDYLLKIRKDHPAASLSFDITGGSKDLSLALYQLAFWCGADVYYAPAAGKGNRLSGLAVPKVAFTGLNPNYRRILSVLNTHPGTKEKKSRILPRLYLFNQLESFYVPVRNKGVKTRTSPTKTDLSTGKRAIIPVLSQGTFTNILSAMESAGLIRESAGQSGNRKEKYYSITPEGELALLFS